MRRYFIVLLLPLLFSFQCEDDDLSGFETSYMIQNNTNSTLFYLNAESRLVEIAQQSSLLIRSDLNNETLPIPPSENIELSSIQLYKNVASDFILSYEQTPIDDAFWAFEETSENRFEYTLELTESLLD